jgi:hypothetical protein
LRSASFLDAVAERFIALMTSRRTPFQPIGPDYRVRPRQRHTLIVVLTLAGEPQRAT